MTSNVNDTLPASHYFEKCCGTRSKKRFQPYMCKGVPNLKESEIFADTLIATPLKSRRKGSIYLAPHQHRRATLPGKSGYSCVKIDCNEAASNNDNEFEQEAYFILNSLSGDLEVLGSGKHVNCNHDDLLKKFLTAEDVRTKTKISSYAEQENIALKQELLRIKEENEDRKQSIAQLKDRLGDLLGVIDS